MTAEAVSIPRRIRVPGGRGSHVHTSYYPPTNPGVRAPQGERPPLVVRPHPGPTTRATARLDFTVQFFTSRGFAVVDVDYRGSSGYGRDYRNQLTGQWGIVDPDDCAQVARHLVGAGAADPRRVVVSWASAGGFCALRALLRHDVFAAAVSISGITDLVWFRLHTHKFQSHKTDRLIGPYPEAAATYRSRSPVRFAVALTRPVLLVHGQQDVVAPYDPLPELAAALRGNGVRCSVLTFQDEGHAITSPAHRAQVLEAELSFYHDVLGMRTDRPQAASPPASTEVVP